MNLFYQTQDTISWRGKSEMA